jgi:hypothetical protein
MGESDLSTLLLVAKLSSAVAFGRVADVSEAKRSGH